MTRPPKSTWAKMDFTRCAEDIAAELGITPQAVYRQCNKRGVKPIQCPSAREMWKMIHGLRAMVANMPRNTTGPTYEH